MKYMLWFNFILGLNLIYRLPYAKAKKNSLCKLTSELTIHMLIYIVKRHVCCPLINDSDPSFLINMYNHALPSMSMYCHVLNMSRHL